MLQSLGIEKGKPFKPDTRMKNILRKASIVGYNMSRVNRYASRDDSRRIWEGRQWEQPWIGEKVDFMEQNYLNLNSRAAFFHIAYSSSPAMVDHLIDKGAKYPLAMRDADGKFLNGSNTYKLEIPPKVPAKIFWSVSVYNAFSGSGSGQWPAFSIHQLHGSHHLQRGRKCYLLLWSRTSRWRA